MNHEYTDLLSYLHHWSGLFDWQMELFIIIISFSVFIYSFWKQEYQLLFISKLWDRDINTFSPLNENPNIT